MTIYTIDTNLAQQPVIDRQATEATLVSWFAYSVMQSYKQQTGAATFDEALSQILDNMQDGLPKSKRYQIREKAAEILAAGVSVPGGKLIGATDLNAQVLATAASTNAAGIADLALPAVGGGVWQVNTPARATTARNTILARIAAVNAVRDAALAAYAADKNGFDVAGIVWP